MKKENAGNPMYYSRSFQIFCLGLTVVLGILAFQPLDAYQVESTREFITYENYLPCFGKAWRIANLLNPEFGKLLTFQVDLEELVNSFHFFNAPKLSMVMDFFCRIVVYAHKLLLRSVLVISGFIFFLPFFWMFFLWFYWQRESLKTTFSFASPWRLQLHLNLVRLVFVAMVCLFHYPLYLPAWIMTSSVVVLYFALASSVALVQKKI